MPERYDVLIIGSSLAGYTTAIKLEGIALK
jgi:thioredoxin reductase